MTLDKLRPHPRKSRMVIYVYQNFHSLLHCGQFLKKSRKHKGISDLSSVTFRTLTAVTSFTLFRYLWIDGKGVQKMNFRIWIFENEIFRLKNEITYTYLLNVVYKELEKKFKLKKNLFFFIFWTPQNRRFLRFQFSTGI